MKQFYQLTPKAKRVLYPLLFMGILNFTSYWFHSGSLPASAFPFGGSLHEGNYIVRDHGRDHELTPTQFWLSYVHGASVAVIVIVYLGALLRFRQTGDLKRVATPA
jgi:hypothetical protein